MTSVPTARPTAAAALLDQLVASCAASANLLSAAADCSRDDRLRDAFARLWLERVEFVGQLERVRQLIRSCTPRFALPRRSRPAVAARTSSRAPFPASESKPAALTVVLRRCARREDAVVAAYARTLARVRWSPAAQRLLRRQAAATLDALGQIRTWAGTLRRRQTSSRPLVLSGASAR